MNLAKRWARSDAGTEEPEYAECLNTVAATALTFLGQVNPENEALSCGASFTNFVRESIAAATAPSASVPTSQPALLSELGVFEAGTTATAECLGLVSPELSIAIAAVETIANGAALVTKCGPVVNHFCNYFTLGSIDPNDKGGPAGDNSASRWITGATPLNYQVAFENQPPPPCRQRR